MYLQITTRCNMQCAHCCFRCTNKGVDMTLTTFRAALLLAGEHEDYITIGGGEPTVHPKFELMLLEAIAAAPYDEHAPSVITNGKHFKRAMLIAKLTKAGVVCGELSQDRWHEPIDARVVEAFKSIGERGTIRDVGTGWNKDWRHERRVDRDPIPMGRAVEFMGYSHGKRECSCDDHFVTPDGTIRQCGCPRAPIVGHVDTGWEYRVEGCYRSEQYRDELEVYREEAA